MPGHHPIGSCYEKHSTGDSRRDPELAGPFFKLLTETLDTMTNVTQSALARHLKVSRQAVHDLVKRGILEPDANGLIDLDLAKHALARKTRPSGKTAAALEPSAEQEETHHAARARRERAEATMAELKLAEQRGEVIRVDAIRAALAGVLSQCRDAFMALPARLAPVLAAETDAGRVHRVLSDEVHRVLVDLSRGATQAVGPSGETAPGQFEPHPLCK